VIRANQVDSNIQQQGLPIMRKLILALAFAALCPSGASCFAQQLNYLAGQKLNLLKLLPPPPPPHSEAEKRDISEVLEVQENRTPERAALGLADDVLSIYRFSTVLGPKFEAENIPVTDAFFKRLHEDSRAYVKISKEYWSRERPVKVSNEVKPLAPVRLPTAYPSGTTLFGSVTCIVLANMIPEKRFELFERGREFAWGRVVIGVHYPRDLIAGEIGATLIVQGFLQSPEFMKDFEEARAELRQVLGYPAEVPDETPARSIDYSSGSK
jgi:acid phosphatase (class A)